jgi:predicted DNA-binding protein (UPF0251 family)
VYPSTEQNSSGVINPDLKVPFFSRVADCGIAGSRVYLAIRALDIDCKGYLEISIKDLSKALGVDQSTVYRALKEKVFFVASSRKSNGKRVVSYRSIKRVCADLDIDLGAIGHVSLRTLGDRMKSAVAATEMEAQMGQEQAHYRAKKGQKAEKIYHPHWAVTALSEKEKENQDLRQSTNGSGLQSQDQGFRFFRVKPNEFCPGISQQAIAKRTGRSRRTVQRRLQNANRLRWGCDPLSRRRVIQSFDQKIEATVQYHLLIDLRSKFGVIRRKGRLIHVGILKIGKESPRAYRLMTNIYKPSFLLHSRPSIRRRVATFKKESIKGAPCRSL